MISKFITLMLLTVAVAHSAQGSILCEYAAYSTSTLRYTLPQVFMQHGAAILPPSSFDSGNFGLGTGDLILRSNKQYGWLQFAEDIREGTSTLNVLDTDGNKLASSYELQESCYAGICHESHFDTYLGMTQLSLSIYEVPGEGTTYFINGNNANVTLWRDQFSEAVDWVISATLDQASGRAFSTYSRRETLSVLLASDPIVSPYLPHFVISEDRNGHVVVSGRMNQAVYDSMIDTALANGFSDIVPDVVIDSAAVIFPQQGEELMRCL